MADRTYWKCSSYSKTKCRARVTTRGTVARLSTEGHNHPPDSVDCNGLMSHTVSIVRK